VTHASGRYSAVDGRGVLERVEWSERLEVGIPSIDDQHKRFFDLAADLAGEEDQVRVMRSLAQLSDYVRTHFQDEEALMAAANYPGTEAHRRSHQEFRQLLADLLVRARTMSLDEIAEEVRYLINGWIHRHIMVADLQYLSYLAPA